MNKKKIAEEIHRNATIMLNKLYKTEGSLVQRGDVVRLSKGHMDLGELLVLDCNHSHILNGCLCVARNGNHHFISFLWIDYGKSNILGSYDHSITWQRLQSRKEEFKNSAEEIIRSNKKNPHQ